MTEIDEQIAALQKVAEELAANLVAAQTITESNREEAKKVADEKARLQAAVSEARIKENALNADYHAKMRAVKELRARQDEENRKLQKLLDERALAAKLAAMSDAFDRDTAGAAWREWARNHQITGGKHIAATKRCVLGDERGLGKSLTSLIALDMLKSRKTIIFTPKDVSVNFEKEVKRWTDRKVIVLTGMGKIQRDMMLAGLKHVKDCTIILNYEAWRKDKSFLERLIELQFDTVIIDEAHKIKNHTGPAYKGIYSLIYAENCCPVCSSSEFEISRTDARSWGTRICSKCLYEQKKSGEFCSVKNVVPMTGTSIINKPQDIWPLLQLVDNANFNNVNYFLQDYCEQNFATGHWGFKSGGEARLLKSLGMKFIGRDRDTAGVKMPPQHVTEHVIDFDPASYPKQWGVINQVLIHGAIKLAENKAMGVMGALAEITRIQQALTWPNGIIHRDPETNLEVDRVNAPESVKIDKAVEIILDAIEEGHRVVLFSRFKEALKEVQRRLNELGITNVRYDGDLREDLRQEAQNDFDIKTASKTDYKFKVFLGQYQTAGTGINLTGAQQMVILDRYFAPGYEDQASGRIQRLDSTEETIVHNITVNLPPIRNQQGRQITKIPDDSWMNNMFHEKQLMLDGMQTANLAASYAQIMEDFI